MVSIVTVAPVACDASRLPSNDMLDVAWADRVEPWGIVMAVGAPPDETVPLVAGIFEMSYWRFQIANFVSALVWSAALLLSGDVIAQIAEWLWRAV